MQPRTKQIELLEKSPVCTQPLGRAARSSPNFPCPRKVLIYLFQQLSWQMTCLGVCSSGKCEGKVTRLVGNSTSCRGQLDGTFFKPHLRQPYSI